MAILFLAAARVLAARTVLAVAMWLRLNSPTSTWPRNSHSATAIGDVLYFFGGHNGTGNTTIGVLFTYTPSTGVWQLKASSTSRSRHVAGTINGKLYVCGGQGSSAVLDSTLEYNPTNNSWLAKAPLPGQRVDAAGAVIDGKLYLFAGRNSGGTFQSTLYVFDPIANTWQTKASGGFSRVYHSAVAINGKLYVFGGISSGGVVQSTLHVYDPITNIWTALPSAPIARTRHTAVVINGKMYVYGGSNVDTYVYIYDPDTGVWTTDLKAEFLRQYDHAAAVINGKMYVYGGNGSPADVNDAITEYTPPS